MGSGRMSCVVPLDEVKVSVEGCGVQRLGTCRCRYSAVLVGLGEGERLAVNRWKSRKSMVS